MKKKVRRSQVKVSTKKSHAISHPRSLLFTRSIIIVGGTLGVLTLALISSKQEVLHAVQGAQIVRGMYMEALIPLPQIPGAVGYNIYYTPDSEAIFSNAVRSISPDYADYTIAYLKKGTTYKYKISAIDATGKEFWYSPMSIMTNLQGM